MSVWSVVEPLTLEFNIDIPIEISKSQNQYKASKLKVISTIPRSDVTTEIQRLADSEKMEMNAISAKLGVSLSTVRRVCRTHKIGNYSFQSTKIVSRSSQVPFGWDVAQGRLQQNPKEWAWVLEIQRLRGSGTSLHKIADFLASQKVATKNGGKWFAKTVSQILKFNRQHLFKTTDSRRKLGTQ
ncbi:MAG: hypothetical protein A4S09_15030 [Proteobacteria bacterium SG_bin7]|nr:MAG: hypothetical protein A4S09_15030 [Proteobacteria bacterium SG_bin7]